MFYKVIKTNKIIPKRFEAFTIGPVILIRPESYKDALIEHEKIHVKQFYRYATFNWLFYLIDDYRLDLECEAYAKTIMIEGNNPSTVYRYANFIQENYNLKSYSVVKIVQRLEYYIKKDYK